MKITKNDPTLIIVLLSLAWIVTLVFFFAEVKNRKEKESIEPAKVSITVTKRPVIKRKPIRINKSNINYSTINVNKVGDWTHVTVKATNNTRYTLTSLLVGCVLHDKYNKPSAYEEYDILINKDGLLPRQSVYHEFLFNNTKNVDTTGFIKYITNNTSIR
ncbi:MAG: hypothetical protein BAJALOKI3v1_50004 [Promethearchaeota archaeon]|nr:MAG: hypothetical protein BAJALOKI3v1_50004 [Candidatus Lokiarchaeota archaeon]